MTNWYDWFKNIQHDGMSDDEISSSSKIIIHLRNLLLNNALIKKNSTVIDIGCGFGLLGTKIAKVKNGNGKVIFLDIDDNFLNECKKYIKENNITTKCEFINSNCTDMPIESNSIDNAVMRSCIVHVDDKQSAFNEIYRILNNDGIFCAIEPVISDNKKIWQILPETLAEKYKNFAQIEDKIYSDNDECIFNYNEKTIEQMLHTAGFKSAEVKKILLKVNIICNNAVVDGWFNLVPAPNKLNLYQRFLKYTDKKSLDTYICEIKKELLGQNIEVSSAFILIKCKK